MAGGSRPGRSILPLYRIFMTLTYTIPSCCMSRLIAFIVPPPGVRAWREVWLIFPPLNLGTHHLDGEQNKIGNNTPAKSRLCEGLLRRSTHFDLGVPQVSKWSKKSSVVYSQAGHLSLLAGNQDSPLIAPYSPTLQYCTTVPGTYHNVPGYFE